MIFRQRLERVLFIRKAIGTSIFVITSLSGSPDIFTIPSYLDKHTLPWLKTSPYSRLDKVKFTVISKTALLCWQKSSQGYISDNEGILKAPFLLSSGAMRRGLEIQTGVFQNERQLNYLPDGVWPKSLICSHNKSFFDHFSALRFFFIHLHFPAYIMIFKTYGPTLWITQQYRIMKAATKARSFRLAVRVKMVPLQKACHTWLIHRRILMVQQGWLGKDK